MIRIRAKEILYCGDHITGDTGATKNELQRTLYICPEIKREIAVMSSIPDLYRRLSKLERQRGQILQRCCDESLAEKPQELEDVEQGIADVQQQIDSRFNANFGSIFTTTWGKTWLSQYLQEHSDLYTGELVNLANYPPFYVFTQNYDAELPHQEMVYAELQKTAAQTMEI